MLKSERLLTMISLLQVSERRTARELAERLEVSERTIFRDIDTLSGAGVPVYAERGATGGIVLDAGYRSTLMRFSDDEIRALVVSAANPLADLGLATAPDGALAKISASLPDAQRGIARRLRDRIHIDQRRWYTCDQPKELLATLRSAALHDRKVRIRYRDREGAVTSRTVEPFGLVAKAGVWYLVARDVKGMRTFRAERMLDAIELPQSFERPVDFDLDAYWRAWMNEMASPQSRYAVTLRVCASAIDDVTRYWETQILSEPGLDGDLQVRVVFPAPDAALYQLLGWGLRVKIVEPDSLRVAVVERARELLEHYGDGR